MKKPTLKKSKAIREKLYHRVTVVRYPTPANTSFWRDPNRAATSQRAAAMRVHWCLQILTATYNTSSTPKLLSLLPPIFLSIANILIQMQSHVLPPPKIHPNRKNNLYSKTNVSNSNQYNYSNPTPTALWRTFEHPPLPPTFPKSRAHLIPSKAEAEESKNLHKINIALINLNRAADLCLDYDVAMVAPLKAVFASLASLLATLRPTWQPPKFTTAPLTPRQVATPIPKKYVKPEQFTDEWRRQRRVQWHKQRGTA